MRTTVSYEFTHDDSQGRIDAVLHAHELQDAITEYAQWLRAKDKYGDEDMVPIAEIRQHFWEFMTERGVNTLID